MSHLRNPEVVKCTKVTIILLNSLFKALMVNEGVHFSDDIYRHENKTQREKVVQMLKYNPDVTEVLKKLSYKRSLWVNN